MEKMYYRDKQVVVNVAHFFEKGTALIFDPGLAGVQNGNGWLTVKANKLLPLEYYNENAEKINRGFMSSTKKNEIKKRLNLAYSIWMCTDKKTFTDVDEAIKHEKEIMIKEKEANVKQ